MKIGDKKRYLVVYLQRDKLSLFLNAKNSKVISLKLDEIVKDLDVVNSDLLKSSLEPLSQDHRLTSSQALIILADDTYFIQKIPKTTKEKKKIMLNKFADLVPFENVFIKDFNFNKQNFAIAINRNLYEPFIKALSEIGVQINAMIPGLVIRKTISQGLNATNAKILAKSIEKLNNYNFLGVKKEGLQLDIKKQRPETKEDKIRLILLITTFVVLLVVLVGVTYYSFVINKPTPPQPQILESTPQPTKTTESIPEKDQASPSASPYINKPLSDITISILNGSGISGQASKIAQALSDVGFNKISAGNAPKSSSSKTLIIFSPDLTSDTKNLIIENLKSFKLNYVVQTSDEINQDILIITAPQEN